MNEQLEITVDGGKYTFRVPKGDWRPHVDRHGRPWIIIEQGSGAVVSMMSELRDSRELIEAVMKWGGFDGRASGDHKHGELYEAIRRFRELRGLS